MCIRMGVRVFIRECIVFSKTIHNIWTSTLCIAYEWDRWLWIYYVMLCVCNIQFVYYKLLGQRKKCETFQRLTQKHTNERIIMIEHNFTNQERANDHQPLNITATAVRVLSAFSYDTHNSNGETFLLRIDFFSFFFFFFLLLMNILADCV